MSNNVFDIGRLMLKLRTAKRWWLPPAILAIAAINTVGIFLPKKYTATALVLIRQTQSSDSHINDTLRLNDTLSTIKEQIDSYSFLAEIARSLNMDAGVAPDSQEYQGLIQTMRKNLELAAYTDHFTVSYSGFTPREAHDVTDKIVTQYMTQTSKYYGGMTDRNVKFLQDQQTAAHLKVVDAQSKIREYKDSHINEIPEQLPGYSNQLSKRRDEQQTTRGDLQATSIALKQALAALEKEPQVITTQREQQTEDRSNADLKKQERDLKLKIQMMLDINGYTEEHWEVKTARKQLALIEDQLASTTQETAMETISVPNPNYQNLQNKITDYQLKIAGLRKQQSEQQADIDKLEIYMAAIPKNQDILSTLDRNLANAQAEEQNDTIRLNQAIQASALEAQGMGPSFDYRDPPQMPTAPSSPNRFKIAVLSVFLGGAAAAGLIFLLAMFDSTIRSVDEARQVLQMPVLGIVQSVVSAGQIAMAKRRRRLIWSIAGVAIVMILAAGAIGLTQFHDEVKLGVDQFRDMLKKW